LSASPFFFLLTILLSFFVSNYCTDRLEELGAAARWLDQAALRLRQWAVRLGFAAGTAIVLFWGNGRFRTCGRARKMAVAFAQRFTVLAVSEAFTSQTCPWYIIQLYISFDSVQWPFV